MANPQTQQAISLEVRRTIDAPRSKVYAAWTDPKQFEQWFPPEGFECKVADMDLRPGGSYRVGVKPADDDMFYAFGTYKEVRPPERLAFTWGWTDSDHDWNNSLVTIDFHDAGGKTEIVIKHEGFSSEAPRDEHTIGWNKCIDRVAQLVSKS
ncbi:MAG: hypothetical protein DLM53_05945 [Candidatus Eremiobacter antarcticus]|nr:SRPBCC domain-containing protein [Candidatus Eremiobacteraeota bacterium]PZR62360.1 MAG: hypothetical protein DLM53_05945 [Candidatus Eremiobacter sp. RRmetagenome_bin22]